MTRAVIKCGWGDVPHLTDDMISEMTKGMMPHLREARMNGTPTLGSGAIYPVPEEDIVFDPSQLQLDHAWRRAFGFDVGWKRNAGIWGAYDEDADVVYLYDEYYRGYAEPAVHASACKAKGQWIPCIIDSAANGSNQIDGRKLFHLYQQEGLNCINANKAVDAGLLSVYQRLSTGRLKVSKNLVNWLNEFRIYRRDDKGRIVKENDHLMDATRYLIMGLANFQYMPTSVYAKKQGNHGRAEMRYNTFDETADTGYNPF